MCCKDCKRQNEFEEDLAPVMAKQPGHTNSSTDKNNNHKVNIKYF